MNEETLFNYTNTWTSPRFFRKQNIGDFVGNMSLGINLEEFQQTKSFFRTSGTFKVSGDYPRVKQFAQALEKEYWDHLSFHAEWSFYDKLI
jgi:hypothetical protein